MQFDPRIMLTGRVKAFLGNIDYSQFEDFDEFLMKLQELTTDTKVLPASCTVYVYQNDLFDCIKFVSRALRYGAGVKVQLEHFKPGIRIGRTVKWGTYLEPFHPDYTKYYKATQEGVLPLLNKDPGTRYVQPEDSMEDVAGIEDSWKDFIHNLEQGISTNVDLSKLRPNGTKNAYGMVATGPCGPMENNPQDGSFFSIYKAIYDFMRYQSIGTLMQLLGQLNQTLIRGGAQKGGIVCTGYRYDAPYVTEYLNYPLAMLSGGQKKALRIDEGLLKNPKLLSKVVQKVNKESLFLEKIDPTTDQDLWLNVCVTGDTVVETTEGPRKVESLVDQPFTAVVEGKEYKSISPVNGEHLTGFFYTGTNPVYQVNTKEGYSFTGTANHKLISIDGPLEISKLTPGTQVKIDRYAYSVVEQVNYVTLDSYVTVTEVLSKGMQPTFNCTIEDIHQFTGNGFITPQCEEIKLKHTATCLLLHVNAGQCKNIQDFEEALVRATRLGATIHKIWRDKADTKASIYRPLEDDRQIGIGVVGWANFLANQGISYKAFVTMLRDYFENPNKINPIAYGLATAYWKASNVAEAQGLERLFTMAPTQKSAYDNVDINGNTLCRSIDPPFNKRERRISNQHGHKWVYHGEVETVSDLTPDEHQLMWEDWYRIMASTGKAHSMSFDNWKLIDESWIEDFLTRSPLPSTYYQMASRIDQSYLNKGRTLRVLKESKETQACSLTPEEGCVTCGE